MTAVSTSDLLTGISRLPDGSFRLQPGYYWITLTNDPNGWYYEALKNEEALGNLTVRRIAPGLPNHSWDTSIIDVLDALDEAFFHDLLGIPGTEMDMPQAGTWILFQVHRPMVWRMPYLGVHAWGPFFATKGAETYPEDVGQQFLPPVRWWKPTEWEAPKISPLVPWGMAALGGVAVYFLIKGRR